MALKTGDGIEWIRQEKRKVIGEKEDTESVVRDIRGKTLKKYSAEYKIWVVLEEPKGETGIAEIYRREGIIQNVYHKWSGDFVEAGKKRFHGVTEREATSMEVVDLKKENKQLKELVAELSIRNRILTKSLNGTGSEMEDQ
jgi:transposase